jgi:excisionase family DNA binding protein
VVSGGDGIGVDEAAARLGLTRSAVLKAIADGRLPARRDGRRWLVAATDLAGWVPWHRRTAAERGVAELLPRLSPARQAEVLALVERLAAEAGVEEAPGIDPGATYDVAAAATLRGVQRQSVVNAIRGGRLAAERRGGTYAIAGAALLAWRPRPRVPSADVRTTPPADPAAARKR